jgi:hypothetical protein
MRAALPVTWSGVRWRQMSLTGSWSTWGRASWNWKVRCTPMLETKWHNQLRYPKTYRNSHQGETTMNVQHIETDTTDETTIDWYCIDGVTYGATSDGKILDSDGVPLVNDTNARWAIERFVNAKAPV